LSTRLKQYAYVPIAALALWAVLLAASPAAANAQESPSPSKDPRPTEGAVAGAERVVVAPGDSLWSISAQWLGPDATTRQITDGVERIYVLNRDRIGTDPNLLFAGQRLVLPPAERRTPERASAVSKREVGKTDGKADQNVRQAAARTEPAPLPELAQAAPVPAVGSLTSTDAHSPSLAESAVSERLSEGLSRVGKTRSASCSAAPSSEYQPSWPSSWHCTWPG
jgi:LysM domain